MILAITGLPNDPVSITLTDFLAARRDDLDARQVRRLRAGLPIFLETQDGPLVHANPVFSTGYDTLDTGLGTSGWPRARVIEVFGKPVDAAWAMGGTPLGVGLTALGQMQAAGGMATFVNLRRRFDRNQAKQLGVDVDHLLVGTPHSLTEAFDRVEGLVKGGTAGLIVLDVPPRDPHDPVTARIWSQTLRKLTGVAWERGTTILVVNEAPGSVEHAASTAANALKFYASVRVETRRAPAGVEARIVKNKLAPPFRTALLVADPEGATP